MAKEEIGVEAAESGQRPGEIVLDQLDTIVAGESPPRRRQHQLREIEPDSSYLQLWAIGPQTSQQPAVARPQVEHAPSVAGHVLEQDALALRAVRECVRAAEIAIDLLLVGGPLLSGHGGII